MRLKILKMKEVKIIIIIKKLELSTSPKKPVDILDSNGEVVATKPAHIHYLWEGVNFD